LWSQYHGTWKQSDMVTLDETVEERKVNAPDRNRRLRDRSRGIANSHPAVVGPTAAMDHLEWVSGDAISPPASSPGSDRPQGDPPWDGQLALGKSLSLGCQSPADSRVEETSCAPVRSRTRFALAVQFRSSQ
jgi:hypothetical protein